ncbi:SDR family NAD(P)-dependent oxidoreductase [Candidatus Riflebacteria bacterium]
MEKLLVTIPQPAGILKLDSIGYRESILEATPDERDSWLQKHLIGTFFLGKFLYQRFWGEQCEPFLWTATQMGGDFGISRKENYFAGHGGICGFLKSLKKELPAVNFKILDFSGSESKENIILHLWDELKTMDPCPEVAYKEQKRFVQFPVETNLPHQANNLTFTRDDLILVSGGARGITAAIVREIASHSKTRFLLLGRSPLQTPGFENIGTNIPAKALKGVIFKELQNRQGKVTPVEVDRISRQILASREVNSTLNEIKSLGSEVYYLALDINAKEILGDELNAFQEKYAAITAFIHGAGILQDKLVKDKTPEQFNSVIQTKIDGFFNIFNSIAGNSLKLVAAFTSVAGKFGNQGQSDYAAANEILNHICLCEAKKFPQTRFLAVNWGPWEGGMVSEDLAKMFKGQGIGLIPLDKGSRMFVDELLFGDEDISEVIIGSENLELGGKISERQFSKEIVLDVNESPFLKDHCLKQDPVLPVVYLFEIISELGHEIFPYAKCLEIRDLLVKSGISFDSSKICLNCQVKEVEPHKDAEQTLFITVSSRRGEKEVLNYTGYLDLAKNRQKAPDFKIPEELDKDQFPLNLDEMYRKHLFHGPIMKAILAVKGISKKGIVARLKTSQPADFFSKTNKRKWQTDPLVLDGMAQMGLVWLGHNQGHIGIPVSFDSYIQFSDFKGSEVTCYAHLVELNKSTYQILMDCYFLDAQNRLLAMGTGWKSIFHESFNAYTTAAKEA